MDIFIISLGEAGRIFYDALIKFYEDKRCISTSELREDVTLYTINLKLEDSFNYDSYSNEILKTIENKPPRTNYQPVDYIVVGDISEIAVSSQLIDIACMLHLLDKRKLVNRKSLTGYFTYSDLVVNNYREVNTSKSISSMIDFVEKISEYTVSRGVTPDYGNNEIIDEEIFSRINLYVSDNIDISVKVFVEKIFAECFVFPDLYDKLTTNRKAYIDSNPKNCFSSIGYAVIPIVAKLQSEYLCSRFEEYEIERNTNNTPTGINAEYFRKEWMSILAIDTAFPLEKAIAVFYNKYVKLHIEDLPTHQDYIGSNTLEEIVVGIKKRIKESLRRSEPNYTVFVQDEVRHFNKVLSTSIESLFVLNPLYGHFSLHKKYIEGMYQNILGWRETLESEANDASSYDLDEIFREYETQAQKILNDKVLDFILFKPIKYVLLEKIREKISPKEILKPILRTRLAKEFLCWFEEDNEESPLKIVKKYEDKLSNFLNYIEVYKNITKLRIDYIKDIYNKPYVYNAVSKDELSRVLKSIEEKNFSDRNKIDGFAKGFYEKYLPNSDEAIKVIESPKEYSRQLRSYLRTITAKHFQIDIENPVELGDYKKLIQSIPSKISEVTRKSLEGFTETHSTVIIPASFDADFNDILDGRESLDYKSISEDYTMGSIVYITEFLHLPKESLAHYTHFKNITNNSACEENSSKPLSPKDTGKTKTYCNFVRFVLENYMEEEEIRGLCRDMGLVLDSGDIDYDSLSQNIDLSRILEKLSEEKIKDIAREARVPVSAKIEATRKSIVIHAGGSK